LDPGDAKYVDVVHTSTAGIGAGQTNGHSEFFPNGGLKQPGCEGVLGKSTVVLINVSVDSTKHGDKKAYNDLQNTCYP